jgi:hypothetical protein
MHNLPRSRVSLVLPVLLFAAPLSAQPGRMLQVPTVVVQDPQPVSFAFNDTLGVRLDAKSLNMLERLQVRVFAGTKNDVLAQRRSRDGCVEFLTRVYGVTPGIGSSVQVARLDQTWLEPVGNRRFDDGRWVIVFEEGGFSDSILRLNPDDVKRYFAHAVEVTVRQKGYTPDNVSAAVAAVVAERQSGYPPPATPKPCDRVRDVAGVVALLIEACEPPTHRAWLARIFAGG